MAGGDINQVSQEFSELISTVLYGISSQNKCPKQSVFIAVVVSPALIFWRSDAPRIRQLFGLQLQRLVLQHALAVSRTVITPPLQRDAIPQGHSSRHASPDQQSVDRTQLPGL